LTVLILTVLMLTVLMLTVLIRIRLRLHCGVHVGP
jgi:hypothetical protein